MKQISKQDEKINIQNGR
jgi:hypothetical protein